MKKNKERRSKIMNNNERNRIHLLCNAHLDPVWLWRWDEGAAEAISTFRVAADFCEQFDGFVFNHNEAVLYQWIEEYEPELFDRIRKLVKERKWHIMGGWYLQPDCNMVSGEGMIRQIEKGREYFFEKFGCVPEVAVNVDSFGHAKGLVQILEKTGHTGYLFCRPLRVFLGQTINEWNFDTFTWKGYADSEVIGHRHYAIYNSKFGEAAAKLRDYFDVRSEANPGLVLWGIGDHGGGPSKKDLRDITQIIEQEEKRHIFHSNPEDFFKEVVQAEELPVIDTDLNSWAPGCYTTLADIKKDYRELENEFFVTEKMASLASLQSGSDYPFDSMNEALEDLLFAQFHDILPGTVIESAKKDAHHTMGHARAILAKQKTKAFFKLASFEKCAKEGEIPILAYNPHSHEVDEIICCEFHMNEEFSRKQFKVIPDVYQNGKLIPSQLEQEECQMPMQWRRKVAFHAVLPPMSMTRFDCRMKKVAIEDFSRIDAEADYYSFETSRIKVRINLNTGLMDQYTIDGKEYIREAACKPLVIQDDDHSIGTFVSEFSDVVGSFELAGEEEATEFCGIFGKSINPVTIVEEGDVRVVIEAVLVYRNSRLLLRYYLPRNGTEVQIDAVVHWNEKNKMLKLSIPTSFRDGSYYGQLMYGSDKLYDDGKEAVSQSWTAVQDADNRAVFSVINSSTYGSSFSDGEIRMSLLRSPRFGCLIRPEDRHILNNESYISHTDQGGHSFSFWLNGGAADERFQKLDREALNKMQSPYILSFFPNGKGDGNDQEPPFSIKGNIIVSALKMVEGTRKFMIRFYNPEPSDRRMTLMLNSTDGNTVEVPMQFKDHEVKTFIVDRLTCQLSETDMLLNRFGK